jgi:hypothetical protein
MSLCETLFAAEVSEPSLHQAVVAYLAPKDRVLILLLPVPKFGAAVRNHGVKKEPVVLEQVPYALQSGVKAE